MIFLTWPLEVPYRKYLSLASTQQTADTGDPEMNVAEVVGDGDGDQTLITPDLSAETIIPPTVEDDNNITSLLCSL